MSFSYLDNLSVEEAQKQFIEAVRRARPFPAEERIDVSSADGRISSRAVYAKICSPHYEAAAMDGIAVKASDAFGASETTPVTLKAGSFERVDTGDPIPAGRDAVIMIEEVLPKGDDVVLFASPTPWQYVRQIGEDLCAGDMILPSFTEITPAAQGALLAGGATQIYVVRTPKVAVIPTGDELVRPCENPEKGEIIEFNGVIFSSLLKRWGCEPRVWEILPDDPEKITAALKKATEECDAVLLSAGGGAGRDDYGEKCIANVGRVLRHGVAVRPGKPVVLAMAGDVPIIGTPGYPVSAALILELFFLPVARWLGGLAPKVVKADKTVALRRPVTSSLKYKEYIRARLGFVEGELVAAPTARAAGIVSGLAKADGIIEIEQNSEGADAGETVALRSFYDDEELRNALLIIGSHDPMIDEITDIARICDRNMRIASAHVGSTGGVLALKRREAHMAGIHLLDPESGEYNKSYLRKYFEKDEVTLIRGVGRTQGFMVAAGNPHKAKGVGAAGSGLRYVNRQGGSGTRILFDYLLRKNGISPDDVNGYEREETTHTAVAAQIAAGSADLGLGILSAAKIYSLGFIPVCTEEYDFIILKSALESPQTKLFIEILKSDELKKRLERLGGYTTEGAGEELIWN